MAKDIWNRDKNRLEKIKEKLLPNKIFIFWEYDIHNNISTIKQELKNYFHIIT